ncbi:hypothetical protein NCAS_0B07460 [Naumovozyma castellii]|uniref:3-ketodihydrosphingosine reductase TSC10 n=1 Tax=Naumovozyma castellii TaxID=27288 RepID=G0VAA0_NAUCA|nr:hypothetical protein NCAS_0B07460 [Naumovozyma castellii CBS 4309]CCC68830.1 hypothetical protein NCAS_0B07460 [Naumovozyma castellii CBS 4309]
MRFQLNDQIVLITGGSQGLGREFAHKYYHEGNNSKIIVVSRSEKKLIKAVDAISGKTVGTNLSPEETGKLNKNAKLYYYPCDLSDHEAVSTMFDRLCELEMLPTQVYCCAGGSIPKLFKDLTGEELDMGIKMNYSTTLHIAHKVAQLELSNCHLILFSSVTAFFPFIGYSQYAPLKVSLKALVGILRQEMLQNRISCVYPGNFQSEGFELEELTKPDITREIEGASTPISSEDCCNKIIRSLESGYDDITTDLIGWFLMSLDMGLNKHNNKSFLWILQLLIGTIVNLLVVPIYMLICQFQIKRWFNGQQKKK